MTLAKKVVVLIAVVVLGSVLVMVTSAQRQSKQKNAQVIEALEAFVASHKTDPAAKTQIEVAQVLIDCQSSWNASVDKCGKVLVDRYGQDVVGHLVAINAAGGFGQASLPTKVVARSNPTPAVQAPGPTNVDPTGYQLGDGQNGR